MAVLHRTTSDETGSLWQVQVCWRLLHPWSPVPEWLRPQVRGGGIFVLFVLRVYRRGMPGAQASRAYVLEAPESSWTVAIGTAFGTGGTAMAAFLDSMRRDRLLAQVLQTSPQRPIAGHECLTQGAEGGFWYAGAVAQSGPGGIRKLAGGFDRHAALLEVGGTP